MPIQRIPLAQPIESRDGAAGPSAKDSYTQNLFFDTVGNDRYVQKRPGCLATTPQSPAVPFVGSRIMAFQQLRTTTFLPNQIEAYVVVGDTNAGLWFVNSSGVANKIAGSGTGTAYIPETPCFFYVDNFKVMLVDKTVAFIIEGGAITNIIAPTRIAMVQVTNPGSNYLNPTVTLSAIAAPPTVLTVSATGIRVRNIGGANTNRIYSVAVTTQGGAYTAAPTISFSEAPITATVSEILSTTKVRLAWDTTTASDVCPNGTGISGSGVPGGTTISSVGDSWLTLSNASTLTVGQTVTLTGIGSGATATVFLGNLPNAGGSACFFNGRAIVYGSGTQKIYASNVGVPTYFDPLNFVSAESYVDTIRGIARHLNYVVAFGEYSCQFFYDNGSSVGNSLSPALSYNQEVGLFSESTMAEMQGAIAFVGQTKDQGLGVYVLDGAAIKKVSTPAVDRVIKANITTVGRGLIFYTGGHTFYAVHLSDTSDICLVYDFVEQGWYVWDFPVYFAQLAESNNYNISTAYYGAGKYDPQLIAFSPAYYQDSVYNSAGVRVVTIPQVVSQTDILDGGTTKRKFFRRAEAIGNKTTGTLNIQYSDNDYQTFSAARGMDLSASRSQLYGFGQSRRRSFKFSHQSNNPLRLVSVELQYDIGELENDGVIEPVYRR